MPWSLVFSPSCVDGDSVVTVKEIVLSIVGVSPGCRDVAVMVTGDHMTISASYTAPHFHIQNTVVSRTLV